MAQLSPYLKENIMNHLFRNSPMPTPAVLYLALFSEDPNTDTGGVEVVGGGYQRQPITFDAPVDGFSSNSSDVLFPVATAGWGQITHAAIFDDPASGNLFVAGLLAEAKQIGVDDQFTFRVGRLTVKFE